MLGLAGCLLIASMGAGSAHAQSDLPSGFGGISVGAAWTDIENAYEFRRLDSSSTPLDRFAAECGFRSLALDAQEGELLVTVNDFVVTDIGYITPIQPDSDLVAVADLVMRNYGQPDRASMRNLLGQVTIDRDQVNFVTLEYRQKKAVEFTLTGRDQWEYRIRVRYEHHRWHENRTMRCAREREKEAIAAAALAASNDSTAGSNSEP